MTSLPWPSVALLSTRTELYTRGREKGMVLATATTELGSSGPTMVARLGPGLELQPLAGQQLTESSLARPTRTLSWWRLGLALLLVVLPVKSCLLESPQASISRLMLGIHGLLLARRVLEVIL